eukprot:138746_1
MSSITTLAQCDRQLAVICHTPTSICNLMHRHDPYQYNPRDLYSNELIDGGYCNMETWNPSTMHRFKNVEKLSVALEFFNDNAANLITTLSNLRQLSLFDISVTDLYAYVRYSNSQVLSLLESISFVHTRELPPVLCMLKLGLADKLKSISFIDSNLDSLNDYGYEDEDDDDNVDPIYSEYENIVNYILPLQPNNLEVIRFENSSLDREISTLCDDATNAFLNVDRLRLSLSKLKGIVYSECEQAANSDNMFFHLTTNILNNISSLKVLESIHIHCLKDPQLLTSFLNRNNMNLFNAITELCISVPIDTRQTVDSPLGCLSVFPTALEKLCLVIYISPTDSKNMNTLGQTIASILRKQTKLKVFQIVIIMDEIQGAPEQTDPRFCTKRIAVLNHLLKQFAKSFNALHRNSSANSRPLVFRIHVKSCHKTRKPQCKIESGSDMDLFATTIQHLLLNYLMTYSLGKIQIKLSWNTCTFGGGHLLLAYDARSYLQALTRLFRIEIEEGGSVEEDANAIATLYTDRDFKQYAISASNKDIEDKNTKYHENKWKVDCRYCCNTPWV